MAIEDWIDGADYPGYAVEVECNRCGQDGVYWSMTADGWRLFNEDGERHICEPSADDFECVGV